MDSSEGDSATPLFDWTGRDVQCIAFRPAIEQLHRILFPSARMRARVAEAYDSYARRGGFLPMFASSKLASSIGRLAARSSRSRARGFGLAAGAPTRDGARPFARFPRVHPFHRADYGQLVASMERRVVQSLQDKP